MSNLGLKHYTVFLGAPPASSASSIVTYNWRVVSPEATDDFSPVGSPSRSQQHVFYPPATLAEASRRISVLYENIIFKDTSVGDLDSVGDDRDDEYHSSITRLRDGAKTSTLLHAFPLITVNRPDDHDHLGSDTERDRDAH